MEVRARSVSLLAFGALLLAVASVSSRYGGGAESLGPSIVATRGPLEVSLVEAGHLEAARSVTLASEIRSNRAKIVSLLMDGAWARAGDEVVRFDATPFEEERAKILAELRETEAAAVGIYQERKLQIAKAEEALEAARYRAKLAQLSLESYREGSGALSVREAEVRALDAGAELDRLRGELTDLEQMLVRGFVSEGEVDRHRAKIAEVERKRRFEGDRLKATKDVLFPRDLERARADVSEAQESVARSEAVLYHTHEFYEAAIASGDRRVEQVREKLRVADAELGKIALVAPIEGFVILQLIPLESGRRKPQVGDSVWSGQAIATIPDLSQLVVLTQVREVDLHRIATETKALVDVEAYPGLRLNGRVDWIGALAESRADAPWKFFSVRLLLDRTDPRMRPGMSVRLTFLIDAVRDALLLPLDAVFQEQGRTVAYVERGGRVWEEPLVLGPRNDTHVVVEAGLEAGERALLRRPTTAVRRRTTPPVDAGV